MVRWTWWDWSLSLGLLLPSVLWHCWLGHWPVKTVPEMTYDVFSGTLSHTQSVNQSTKVRLWLWNSSFRIFSLEVLLQSCRLKWISVKKLYMQMCRKLSNWCWNAQMLTTVQMTKILGSHVEPDIFDQWSFYAKKFFLGKIFNRFLGSWICYVSPVIMLRSAVCSACQSLYCVKCVCCCSYTCTWWWLRMVMQLPQETAFGTWMVISMS